MFFLIVVVPAVSATRIEVGHQDHVIVGDNVTVDVVCYPSQAIKGWELKVSFDQTILSAISIREGDFFDGYQQFPMDGIIDNENGKIIDIYNLIVGKNRNVSSEGVLCSIVFLALNEGTTNIGLYDVGVCNESQYLPLAVMNGSVTVNSLGNQENEEKKDIVSSLNEFAVTMVSLVLVYFVIVVLERVRF
jgi:hypothetical protein